MSERQPKRPLTPEAFGKFLRWLSQDDEVAVEMYQSIRKRLTKYLTLKGCDDPDELFDETVDIVIGKIEEGEQILQPLAYCYGVARNVWRRYVRKLKPIAISEELMSTQHATPEASEQELQCLECCVNRLSAIDRDVITQYHKGQGSEKIAARKMLADGFGGMNALRVKAFRIRRDLRLCVLACLKRSMEGKLR